MSYMDSYNLNFPGNLSNVSGFMDAFLESTPIQNLANTTASAGAYPDGYMDAFNQPASTTPTAPVNYQTSTAPAPSLSDILSSGYSDMKFPGDPAPSGVTYTSRYGETPTPSFDDLDAAWAAGDTSPYSSSNVGLATGNNVGALTAPSSLNPAITAPTMPTNVPPPGYDRRIRDQYMQTFTDPNMFWDEYSQGQGAQFTNTAARGMAKAGRTGMLPALTSLAHQDYMSNYLPSVRKDMAPGLTYETNWNQNQNQQYGQELDYSKSNYTTNVQKYGTELTYDQGMQELSNQLTDINNKYALGQIDLLMKELDITEDTKAHVLGMLIQVIPELTPKEIDALFAEVGTLIGSENFGAAALQDTISNTGRTDTNYNGIMSNNDNVGGG